MLFVQVRAVLLVFALSLHSIFEGLALGLEPTSAQAMQVFIALSIHKSLVHACVWACILRMFMPVNPFNVTLM
jgi:zinc transporter ZupT